MNSILWAGLAARGRRGLFCFAATLIGVLISTRGEVLAASVNLTAKGTYRYSAMDGTIQPTRNVDFSFIEVALEAGPPADQPWGSIAERAAPPLPARLLDKDGKINGAAGLPVEWDNVLEPGGIDVVTQLNLRTDQSKRHKVRLMTGTDAAPGNLVTIRSPIVPAGVNRTSANSAMGFDISHDFNAAFSGQLSTLDSLVTGAQYLNHLDGVLAAKNASDAQVVTGQPKGETAVNLAASRVLIADERRFSWDSALHEYGHVVQIAANMAPRGGPHVAWEDLSEMTNAAGVKHYTKDQAREVAFGEGYAHFFAKSSQRWAHTLGPGLPDIRQIAKIDLTDINAPTTTVPGAKLADVLTRYTAWDANETNATRKIAFSFDLEANGDAMQRRVRKLDGTGAVTSDKLERQIIARGEFTEATVSRIMQDLLDGGNNEGADDEVTLGHSRMWRLVSAQSQAGNTRGVNKLREFWTALKADAVFDALLNAPGGILEKARAANKEIARRGRIFALHRVAAEVYAAAVPVAPGFITLPKVLLGESDEAGEINNGFELMPNDVAAVTSGDSPPLGDDNILDGLDFEAPTPTEFLGLPVSFTWLSSESTEAADLFGLNFFDRNWDPIDVSTVQFFDKFDAPRSITSGIPFADLDSLDTVTELNFNRVELLAALTAGGNGRAYMQVTFAPDGVAMEDAYWGNTIALLVPEPSAAALWFAAAACAFVYRGKPQGHEGKHAVEEVTADQR
jgi:hypothetical protein